MKSEVAAEQTIHDFDGIKFDCLSAFQSPRTRYQLSWQTTPLVDVLRLDQVVWTREQGSLKYNDSYECEIEEAVSGRRLSQNN